MTQAVAIATSTTAQSTGFHERRFPLTQRHSGPRAEVLAGITTFMTMAYILFVNPSILGAGENGLPFAAVLSVIGLVAGVMTIAMGVFIAIIGFANSGVVIPGPGGGAAVLACAQLSSPRACSSTACC